MKFFSVCLCVFVCLAPLLPTVLSDPEGVWTFGDNCDVSWYKSTEFEFTIDTPEKLAGLAKLVNGGTTSFTGATVILTQDIDLGAHYWEPIGIPSVVFAGVFDGNSKMISNVMVDGDTRYSGLFGCCTGTIKNVHVGGTITSTASSSCVGGVVGYCEKCTVSGCTNEVKVSGSNFAGGVVGCMRQATVHSSQNRGTVSGSYAGGISGGGQAHSSTLYAPSTIKNSFNTGRVSGRYEGGGIAGASKIEYFYISNCYNLGTVTGEKACGIIVSSAVSNTKYFPSTIYNCYNNGQVTTSEIVPYFTNNLYLYTDYSYGRSGFTIGGIENAEHRGTFSNTGELTPLGGESIINKCKNLVDALNAYVKSKKSEDPSLFEWTKGSGSIPAVFAKHVTVTFDANGGSVSTSSKQVSLFSPYGVLPVPVQNGFEFNGWYTAQDGGTVVISSTEVTRDSDHTLYAHWLKKVTVTLNPTGGSVQPSSIIVTETKQYTGLVDATKNGYFFVGWFTSETGGTQVISTTVVTQKNDHTLYAKWCKAVTVTFNYQGGSGSDESKAVGVGMKYGPLPSAARANYYFDGWYTDAEGGTLVNSETTVTNNNDHIIYAHWVEGFTVTLNPNGGTLYTAEKKYRITATVYGDLPKPTKGVSVFLGWFTEKDGGSLISVTTPISPRDDHTLYAHWINKYTVTFDPNGGTVSVSSKVYEEGSLYGELPDAERNYKKFLGWFTRKTGGSKINEDHRVESKDHKLYAHWGEITYTITYNTNGGSLIVPTVLEKGSPITLPDKITKDGFTFDGWFLDPNFMEPFTLTEMPGENIVLYAKWIEDGKDNVWVAIVVPIVCTVVPAIVTVITAWQCHCCCFKKKEEQQPQETQMNAIH